MIITSFKLYLFLVSQLFHSFFGNIKLDNSAKKTDYQFTKI